MMTTKMMMMMMLPISLITKTKPMIIISLTPMMTRIRDQALTRRRRKEGERKNQPNPTKIREVRAFLVIAFFKLAVASRD